MLLAVAGNIGNDIPPDEKADLEASPNDFRDAAMVGLDAMQRANSTMEDFVSNILLFGWYRSQIKPKRLLY